MAAPERFAKRQIPLAPRAPSIHGLSVGPSLEGEPVYWKAERQPRNEGIVEWIGIYFLHTFLHTSILMVKKAP
jgi:hypothetical protein